MAKSHRFNNEQIQATWECAYVELPDNDLTRKTLVLAPIYIFGKEQFKVVSIEENSNAEFLPEFVKVTATVGKTLYSILVRIQQGSETMGAEPPPWALVDGSATEVATGRTLDVGEVFSIFND